MRVLIRNFREIVKMHTGDGKFSCHCGLGIFFLEKNEITILDEVHRSFTTSSEILLPFRNFHLEHSAINISHRSPESTRRRSKELITFVNKSTDGTSRMYQAKVHKCLSILDCSTAGTLKIVPGKAIGVVV